MISLLNALITNICLGWKGKREVTKTFHFKENKFVVIEPYDNETVTYQNLVEIDAIKPLKIKTLVQSMQDIY